MGRRLNSSKRLVALAVSSFLLAGAAAGCSRESERTVHCVDDKGKVVNPNLCDGPGAGGIMPYWLYTSSNHYPVGSAVPSDWTSSRISPSDTTARTNAGLPATGKVGGTTVRSGGFGSGGTGGGAKAGSVGG